MERFEDEKTTLTIAKKHIHLVLILALIGFIILTWSVVTYPTQKLDLWFSLEVQERANGFMDWLMVTISLFGITKWSIILVVLVSLIFLGLGRKKASLFTLFTLLTGLVTASVKYFVNRLRPSVRVIEETSRQSYPSGHVTFYTVFFGFIIYLIWSLKVIRFSIKIIVSCISFFMLVSISLSRVYLGAHWLTDVLGGYCLGVMLLYGLVYLYNFEGVMKS